MDWIPLGAVAAGFTRGLESLDRLLRIWAKKLVPVPEFFEAVDSHIVSLYVYP